MSGIIEIAEAILTTSEQRLEVVSHNIANTGTAGYKSQLSFSDMMAVTNADASPEASVTRSTDFSQGRLTQTGSPLDFAISGSGLFKVQRGDDVYYSRQGNFQYVEGGKLMTPEGLYLQQAGGGDVVLSTLAAKVLADGTILENGLPTGRIGVFRAKSADMLNSLGGTLFTAPQGAMEEASGYALRQGMAEAANVAVADEMVNMMSSIREAETGAKLVQTYDTLIGQAISTFGQGSQ